ncbi:MAG TPA: PatB family C-S lyase [Tepidisphaeraceae bacterium]|jgi:cystathionine beta-lyase|nr:PatB family C-S lyase [Tepidisphaeraceae bacterium]
MPSVQFQIDQTALRHPDSFKWTKYPQDVLPLWVADMDFPVAPSIITAITDRLRHGIGYHQLYGDPELTGLLRAKLEKDGLVGLPEKGWMGYLVGVVQGLYVAVTGLTRAGDDVITMTPIYPPFMSAITDHGRNARLVALAELPEGWTIDWPAMEAAVTPATRLLMLCHPHNPTGRVWTRDELARLADFADRHRLWVVSDELHADLTLSGEYVPFVAVAPPAVQARTVTLIGPCKAYNTAGLGIGAMVSHNPQLIARLKKAGAGLMGHPGVPNVTMWKAALRDDGIWLAEVLDYLRGNTDLIAAFVRDRLPGVRYVPPQATYLAWLDFRNHPRAGDIHKYLLETAKVALNDGPAFGPGYQGFVRLNFATSKAILSEALERIAAADVAR